MLIQDFFPGLSAASFGLILFMHAIGEKELIELLLSEATFSVASCFYFSGRVIKPDLNECQTNVFN